MSRMLVALGAMIFLVAVAAAQPSIHPLPNLNTKEALTDEDRAALRKWISDQVNAALSEESTGNSEALNKLRQAVEGSKGYREAFAAVMAQVIKPALPTAKSATTAARLVALVYVGGEPTGADLLIETLKDERPGVRAAAAAGLRALRPKLAGRGDTLSKGLAAMRDAGKGETSRDTLRTFYRALGRIEGGGAELRQQWTPLLELLEARAAKYTERKVAAEGADEAGLGALLPFVKDLNDDEKKRVVAAVGAMLRTAIADYTTNLKLYAVREDAGPQRELRDAVALLIDTGERVLQAALAPATAPSVAAKMANAEATDMKTEWRNWVGLIKNATGQDFAIAETETAQEP